jgi:hypothetical protein
MVDFIYIPEAVKTSIKNHIVTAVNRAKEAFPSAYEDEDVFTGVLFGLLKIGPQRVIVQNDEINGTWSWEIDFKKFGGRGKGATESILGADGVFELHLQNANSQVTEKRKSLLFQSKLDWTTKDLKLYQQCARMLAWREASIVINYTYENLETFYIDSILKNLGQKPEKNLPLEELLGSEFINCKIGDSDLFYDAIKKQLIWLDTNNKIISTKFNINRVLKIKVKEPRKQNSKMVDYEIDNNMISNHRLKSNISDTYGINDIKTLSELNKVKKDIQKTFHTDKHNLLPEAQKNILTEILQDYNNKIELQKEKIKATNYKSKKNSNDRAKPLL